MLAASLREIGHTVEVADDAAQALEIAARSAADVAVLDLGLPVIDGCELAARLRALPGWRHTGIVALTGYGLAKDRERTSRAGFNLHLVKPIDTATLDRALRSLARLAG